MKKSIYILVLSLLCASCIPKIDDEGVVPEFLNSVEYGGVVYYIHPTLGEMSYKEAKEACANLDSYGYHDWVLPTKELWRNVLGSPEDVFIKGGYYFTGSYWNDGYAAIVVPIRKGGPISQINIPEANVAVMKNDIGRVIGD